MQRYELIRGQFIDGFARRTDIRMMLYHGLFHGLQHLLSHDIPIASRPLVEPIENDTTTLTPLPAAIVRQLAAVFISTQPEIAHA